MLAGGGAESGFATGIHWHIDLDVDYIADESREDIKWIRATRPDGSTDVFVQDGFDMPEGAEISFQLPGGWQASTPWPARADGFFAAVAAGVAAFLAPRRLSRSQRFALRLWRASQSDGHQ